MEGSVWERRGILAGALAFLLTVIGFIVAGSTPDFLDDPGKIANYYTDDSGKVIAAGYIGLLGTAAFIWFVGELRARLRRAEGGLGRLSEIAFGGGIAA